MNPYISIFNEAFAAYQAQAPRPGFGKGYFTFFRHSCTLYPAVATLQASLLKADSAEEAQDIIVKHLMNNHHKNNTHSFNSYLIDALQKNDERCDWAFFEKNKVKTYHGTLYRGMGRGPDIIFNEGLTCKENSSLLNAYRLRTNNSVGISTSKSFDTAVSYALKRLDGSKNVSKPIYVYKIDYRGGFGVDVKYSNPNNFILDTINNVDFKEEVNIMSKVPPEDIVGVYVLCKVGKELFRDWVANPKYVANREIDALSDMTLRNKAFKT